VQFCIRRLLVVMYIFLIDQEPECTNHRQMVLCIAQKILYVNIHVGNLLVLNFFNAASTVSRLQCEIFYMIDLLSGVCVITQFIGIKSGLLQLLACFV